MILSISLLIVLVWSCKSKQEEKTSAGDYGKIPNSILIVYTSGTPFKSLSDVKPEEYVDAVTGPTPKEMNVKMITYRLADKLKEKNYNVTVMRANEVNNYKELMRYNMIIFGTPTYFWNMHYELKEMIDRHFEKIFVLERENFKKIKFMAYAMGEYDLCVIDAIAKIKSAVTDCSGKLDTSMVFVFKKTIPEYDAQIKKLSLQADSLMKGE